MVIRYGHAQTEYTTLTPFPPRPAQKTQDEELDVAYGSQHGSGGDLLSDSEEEPGDAANNLELSSQVKLHQVPGRVPSSR